MQNDRLPLDTLGKRNGKETKSEKLEKDTSFTTAEDRRQEMELVSSYTANGKTRSWK